VSQEGTQAIRRAASILQRIAHVSDGNPATLRAISEAEGLSRSTAHRILKGLVDVGLATYDSATKQYEIGMLCYELGLAVTDRVLELGPWIAAVDRIAERANVTPYLMRRSGVEAVCIHKAEGRNLIRVIPVEVGQRRYLGVGAGATALLAGLSPEAVDRIIASITPELAGFENLSPQSIRDSVAETRQSGFAESRGRAYRSIFGLGRAISVHSAEPDIAISIAAHASEITEDHMTKWRRIILDEITRAEQVIGGTRAAE
jgi:DNA-binding IclR family transcriptional regulator